MAKLIGLAGRMGSGKDTVAALLATWGYQRTALADPLREEVRECLAGGNLPAEAPFVLKAARALGLLTADRVWQKPTGYLMRWMLQWHGTEYRRSQDTAYWIKILFGKIDRRMLYCVSDIRFPNEAEAIKRAGGEVWLIQGRESRGARSSHHSESLAGITPDRIIDNSGSQYDLALRVKMAMDETRPRRRKREVEEQPILSDVIE